MKHSEKTSRPTQRSQRIQAKGPKNSQICLFTGEEHGRSQGRALTLAGQNQQLTHPHTPHLQDSTTLHGDMMESEHSRQEEFSRGNLRHHPHGIGRRMDGFGTPNISIDQESPPSNMSVPDSCGYPVDYSPPSCFNLGNLARSERLNALQTSNDHGGLVSTDTSSPVTDMMNTFIGGRNSSHTTHDGDVLRSRGVHRRARNAVELYANGSEGDEVFTHRRSIQRVRNGRARVIEEDEDNHDSDGIAFGGPWDPSNGGLEGNDRPNVASNLEASALGNTRNGEQQEISHRRRAAYGDLVNRRSKRSNHNGSCGQQQEDTRDKSNLRSEPFSLNNHGGKTSTLVSALVGEEKQQRKEYEKMRKRRWRASKATNGIHMIGCQTSSISVMTKPRLKLFEGMPYGESHVVLVRELSRLIRTKLKSFRYANSITKEEFQHIHTLLHEKYENGNELLLHWTELHAKSLLRTWRKSVRTAVQEHLSNLNPDTRNPPPPLGVSEEEMLEFSKQLADEDFQQRKSDMLDRSKDMVTQRGCANPMGKGGLCKANTHYVSF